MFTSGEKVRESRGTGGALTSSRGAARAEYHLQIFDVLLSPNTPGNISTCLSISFLHGAKILWICSYPLASSPYMDILIQPSMAMFLLVVILILGSYCINAHFKLVLTFKSLCNHLFLLCF